MATYLRDAGGALDEAPSHLNVAVGPDACRVVEVVLGEVEEDELGTLD